MVNLKCFNTKKETAPAFLAGPFLYEAQRTVFFGFMKNDVLLEQRIDIFARLQFLTYH